MYCILLLDLSGDYESRSLSPSCSNSKSKTTSDTKFLSHFVASSNIKTGSCGNSRKISGGSKSKHSGHSKRKPTFRSPPIKKEFMSRQETSQSSIICIECILLFALCSFVIK